MTPPRIELADRERVDDLGPLWQALHDHHAALAPAGTAVRPFAESWRRQRALYTGLFDTAEAFLLLATDDAGDAVGYALAHLGPGLSIWATSDRIATVETLSVLPRHRGQGLGSRLLDTVSTEAHRRDEAEVWVSVLATNDDAIRFYEGRGCVRFSVELRRVGQVPPRLSAQAAGDPGP